MSLKASFQSDRSASTFRSNPLSHLRLVVTRFVQGLFYQRPHGQLHWDPDPQMTEIYISDENVIHVEQIGFRPAITVIRGPVALSSMGFDDALSTNMRTGAKTRGVLVPGTLTLNAMSRNDSESEDLAWFVGESISMLREVLLRQGFFDIGRNVAVGVPSPAGSLVEGDSGDELYATPVTCPFHFQRTGVTVPLVNPADRYVSQDTAYTQDTETQAPGGGYSMDGRKPTEWLASDPIAVSRSIGLLVEQDSNSVPTVEGPDYLSSVLPILPDPDNPTKRPTAVRVIRTGNPSTDRRTTTLRGPSIRGRSIPIR